MCTPKLHCTDTDILWCVTFFLYFHYLTFKFTIALFPSINQQLFVSPKHRPKVIIKCIYKDITSYLNVISHLILQLCHFHVSVTIYYFIICFILAMSSKSSTNTDTELLQKDIEKLMDKIQYTTTDYSEFMAYCSSELPVMDLQFTHHELKLITSQMETFSQKFNDL